MRMWKSWPGRGELGAEFSPGGALGGATGTSEGAAADSREGMPSGEGEEEGVGERLLH